MRLKLVRPADDPARTLLLTGAVVLLVVHAVFATGVVGDTTYLLAVFGAAVVAGVAFLRAPEGRRLVPGLIAAGLTSSAIGEVAWYSYYWRGVEPDVSAADVPYFLSYVALGAAMFVATLVRTREGRRRIDADAVLDALSILTVSILVFWSTSISGLVDDQSISPFETAVLGAYPVADAILLALVLRALATPRTRAAIGRTFAAGALCWLASDLGYLLLSLSTPVSTVLDLGWMLGGLLMAAGAWMGTGTAGAELDEEADAGRTEAWQLAIAILPLAVPPLLELQSDLRGGDLSPYLSIIGMAALLVLAFARTARLLASERRARAVVRRSRRHYERLAENSSDAVIVIGTDGTILRGSPHLPRLLGLARIAPDLDWTSYLLAEDAERLTELFFRSLEQPGVPLTSEARVDHDADSTRWLEVRLVNLVDDPDVGGVVVALSDISPRKAVEAELEGSRDAALEGSRAKSAFLATMSHEIRTPMNGVIGLTGLLLTTELDARQRQYAEGVRGAGEALLTLINDILDFSKVEAGKLQLETLDFSLVQVVEDAAELVGESATAKSLELLAYCSPELPAHLRGDPARIRQVLLNLASNAIKFTAEGEVVVRAQLDDTTDEGVVVRFEVSDTGVGIAEEDQERLFDPFSQADSSTTRKYGGTGLGLAICRQLVTAMGGSLGVRSRPGAGSTFWFTLPLERAEGTDLVAAARPGGLSGVRVLVVDDNQTNRLILEDQLGAWGMRPDCVADAGTALVRLAEAERDGAPYELGVLDLCMPEVDGLELARRIRAEAASAPGLVLLTSGGDLASADVMAAGIDRLLSKPVQLSRLATALEEAMAARRDPEAPPAAPTETPTSTRPGGRGHVLVVEDGVTNQLVAVGILEHLGYTTEVAENGLEALAAMEQTTFDAVLMDCQMPEMDGYQATTEIRRREGSERHTPVIAMTASATAGDRERCLQAGMDDYVAKPVHPDEVVIALDRWVSAATA
ncbi:response regulator [Nocardioides sp. 503]|uniref:hybrid sensor histidine kinase/response regulator n=1 Tax=Nocardioides sp. 503 TaxID=2508326 RepID=UPI00106F39D1|nr:response regulator [Nocardioides sp. 503]